MAAQDYITDTLMAFNFF